MDEQEFASLNVIPLVDVMLVLLTIVLTTSTFIATGGIQVQLPQVPGSQQVATPEAYTVTIDHRGQLWFDGQQVSLAKLISQLEPINRNSPILVRADNRLSLQQFVDVFARIKEMGFLSMSLQTQQQA